MAKIISQMTFVDYGQIEILGDLERFLLALEGLEDEALMRRLESKRGKGRDDYPIRVMWHLILAIAKNRIECNVVATVQPLVCHGDNPFHAKSFFHLG